MGKEQITLETANEFRLPLPTEKTMPSIDAYVSLCIAGQINRKKTTKSLKDIENMNLFEKQKVILDGLLVKRPSVFGDFKTCKSTFVYTTYSGKEKKFFFNIPSHINFGIAPNYNYDKQEEAKKPGSEVTCEPEDIEGLQTVYQLTDLLTMNDMTEEQKWVKNIFDKLFELVEDAFERECKRTPQKHLHGTEKGKDPNVFPSGLYVPPHVSNAYLRVQHEGANKSDYVKKILTRAKSDDGSDKPLRTFLKLNTSRVKKTLKRDGKNVKVPNGVENYSFININHNTATPKGHSDDYNDYFQVYKKGENGNTYTMSNSVVQANSIFWGGHGTAEYIASVKLVLVQFNIKLSKKNETTVFADDDDESEDEEETPQQIEPPNMEEQKEDSENESEEEEDDEDDSEASNNSKSESDDEPEEVVEEKKVEKVQPKKSLAKIPKKPMQRKKVIKKSQIKKA